jgi:hypothetical protein
LLDICLTYYSILMMEALNSSETSVNLYEILARHHIPVTAVRTWAPTRSIYINTTVLSSSLYLQHTNVFVCLFFFPVFRFVLEEELRHWKEEETQKKILTRSEVSRGSTEDRRIVNTCEIM